MVSPCKGDVYKRQIQGGSGNIEYLAVVQKGGEAAYLPEIAAVVQQAFAQAKKEKTK